MPKSNLSPPKEGWARPSNSRRYHYFVEGRSLCNGWLFLGVVEAERDAFTERTRWDCRKCFLAATARHGEAAHDADRG